MTRQNGKAPMKITHCVDCGKERSRHCTLNVNGRCHECGVNAMVDAMKQIHERSGPYYDKWRARGGFRGRPPAAKRVGPPP